MGGIYLNNRKAVAVLPTRNHLSYILKGTPSRQPQSWRVRKLTSGKAGGGRWSAVNILCIHMREHGHQNVGRLDVIGVKEDLV